MNFTIGRQVHVSIHKNQGSNIGIHELIFFQQLVGYIDEFVNGEGNFVAAYSSITDPFADKMIEAIESTLDSNKNSN